VLPTVEQIRRALREPVPPGTPIFMDAVKLTADLVRAGALDNPDMNIELFAAAFHMGFRARQFMEEDRARADPFRDLPLGPGKK
jgi:hypothetical protein